MSTIRKFEDLKIWQTARSLCSKVFQLTETGPASKERSSQFEFVNFLSIAKGSSGETRSQLYRGIDQNYFPSETVDLIKEYADLASAISGFIKYLNQSEIRGQKFRDRSV